MINRLRLAKYDTNGDPLFDVDVLSQAELDADRRGYTLRESVEIDPALVEQVARLQRGVA